MTTIPDDMVERVARAIMERRGGCRVTDWSEAERNPNVSAALADARAAIEAMQPAILAERERWAAKADEWARDLSAFQDQRPFNLMSNFAAAIRSQS